MTKKLTEKKRKILRRVYGVLSLSSAMFVFQACYGTPNDLGSDVYIQGLVKSKATNLPIPGIKVSIENKPEYGITGTDGNFQIYTQRNSVYKVKFEDIDADKNGSFLPKDTVLNIVDESTFLNISLDVK